MANRSKPELEEFLLRPEVKERFWSKVIVREEDECWLWDAGRHNRGYGQFWSGCDHRKAHRIAFFYVYGRFPIEGRHTCDNPPCCNPKHVIDGTHHDNMKDCIERGRFPHGEKNGKSKLLESEVAAILRDRRSSRTIAKSYGIGKSTVGAIKRREAWVGVKICQIKST